MLLKVFVFMAAIFVLVQSQARDLCQRPRNSFDDLKHVHEYLDCLKSQASTRYGKRAYPLHYVRLPSSYKVYDFPDDNLQDLSSDYDGNK